MRSIFFWRMIVIIFLTVFTASLLIVGGYMYMSLKTYTEISLAQLRPEAEAIGRLYLEYKAGSIEEEAYRRISDTWISPSSNMWCLITDHEGAIVYQTVDFMVYGEEYRQRVFAQIHNALDGLPTASTRFMAADGSVALTVAIPVVDENGTMAGSVFILKPISEVRRITNRLNRSLYFTALVVLPVMFTLASFGMRRVAEPLRKMGEVAIKMRNGDFDVRADEAHKGEIGLLARALNDLCATLSQTIHQLEAEKGQLKQILASFSEGVAATDSLGCLTHYNDALKHMFGIVRVDTRYDLIPDAGIWDAYDRVYETGEACSMRYPLYGERMLWITIAPVITEEGLCAGVVGLFKDMTDIENLERTRREYVANVSHELRTPLTAVRGLLEPLRDGMVEREEDRQRYYSIMLREVMRLSRLITDMLQLSRLQSGTEYMEPTELDIRQVVEDTRLRYAKEAQDRGITLQLDLPDVLPHVLTDADRVEQVLVILVDNAMHYTPAGGTITIGARVFERVNISVADTGSGIPEEDIPHVFERFYTVDKSRKEGGTGLGLSIAQHIINKLGEKIMVESKVGKGSCFTFTLRKYIINAIALGPVQEEWEVDEAQLPPLLKPQMRQEETLLMDAEYEVLPEKGKKQSGGRQKAPVKKKPKAHL